MRRNLKWLSLALVVSCVIAMVVSRNWLFRLNVTNRLTVQLAAGTVRISVSKPDPFRGTSDRLLICRARTNIGTAFAYHRLSFGHQVVVPLWAPIVAFSLLFAVLHIRDRRRRHGHCRACGYDLTGNVTGVCSECGETIVKTRQHRVAWVPQPNARTAVSRRMGEPIHTDNMSRDPQIPPPMIE